MKNTAKKAVILNNFSSPYISEAIIILRDYRPELEGKIITDAEKIVSAYIEKQERNREKEQFAIQTRGVSGTPYYKKHGQRKAIRVIITLLISAAIIGAVICAVR